MQSKFWLILEWLILFIAFPLFVFSEWLHISRFVLFAPPILYALWHERNNLGYDGPIKPVGYSVGLRIILIISLIFSSAYWWLPKHFLHLPLHRPQLWIVIMLFYPFVSALPQEILYRQFYFRRYKILWPTPNLMITSNIASFALLHIVYDNWIAIFFTLIGGAFFTISYQRTQDLRWSWLEHSLYGLAIFTSGWGRFFYEPTG